MIIKQVNQNQNNYFNTKPTKLLNFLPKHTEELQWQSNKDM